MLFQLSCCNFILLWQEEVRLHFGIKNKWIYFVLLSVCINFAAMSRNDSSRHFGKIEALCLSCKLKTWEIFKTKVQVKCNGSARFAWTVISISALSGFLRTVNLQRGIAGRASFILQGVNSLNFIFNYKFEYYGS